MQALIVALVIIGLLIIFLLAACCIICINNRREEKRFQDESIILANNYSAILNSTEGIDKSRDFSEPGVSHVSTNINDSNAEIVFERQATKKMIGPAARVYQDDEGSDSY